MQVACTLTVEEGWKTTTKKRIKIKANSEKNKFPDVRDWDDIDAISNEEIKLADVLFESEKFEGGMQHLSNAVAVYVQLWRLLQCLHKYFSAEAFHLLLINTEIVAILMRKCR